MNKLRQLRNAIGVLEKTAVNPFFKSKYIDINALLDVLDPELEKLKLTLLQPLTNVNGVPAIKTILMDDDKELISDIITLPLIQDPQKMGGAITYYRRYSIISLLCLRAIDDDGNASSGNKPYSQTKMSKTNDDIPFPMGQVPF